MSRSRLFEHETTPPSDNHFFRISSPVRHVILGQDNLAYPEAMATKIKYPEEEDLLQRYAYDKMMPPQN